MRTLLLDLNGQTVKLVAVELSRNSGVGWKQFKHDHPLAVPPYREHHLFRVKSRLGSGLRGITCCTPRSPAHHVHIMDPFLITSNNWRQSVLVTLEWQQSKSRITATLTLDVGQLVWYPLRQFWHEAYSLQVFKHARVGYSAQSFCKLTCCLLRVGPNQLPQAVIIELRWTTWSRLILEIIVR